MAPRRAEPVNSHVFGFPAAREPVFFQGPALQGAKVAREFIGVSTSRACWHSEALHLGVQRLVGVIFFS